jgi:hypothetical protein
MAWLLRRIVSSSPHPSQRRKVGKRHRPLRASQGGPALGAAINAVVDALAELGVKHVEMPATPERVWRAIQQARTESFQRENR